MFSRIYLKRKFQKNPSEYICLVIAMVVSMMLINIPGVFVDSINKGERLRAYEVSGGYDVVLYGADASDLPYFDEVEGITAVCDGENVGIVVSDAVDRDYTANHISYIVNVNDLDVSVHVYNIADSAPTQLVWLMFAVKVVFAIVGMTAIYFAYVLIFKNRKSEIRTLIKLGITRRQLSVTMLFELFVVYVPSLVLAVLVSNLTVMAIISLFFKASDYYTRFAFDYSVGSFVTLVVLSAAAAVTAFAMSQSKVVSGLYGDYFEVDRHYFRYTNSKVDRRSTSPERLLVKTNLLRAVEFALPCAIVSVVTVVLVLVLTNVIGLIDNDYAARDSTVEVSNAVEVDVTEYNSIQSEQQQNSRVIKAIILFMSSMITLCGMVLIYVFSSLIALKNSTMNKQLVSLGISRKCLKFSTIATVCLRAMLSYSVGLLVSFGLTWYISKLSEIPLGFSAVVVIYNALLLAVVLAAHALPMVNALRNELKTEVSACQY